MIGLINISYLIANVLFMDIVMDDNSLVLN